MDRYSKKTKKKVKNETIIKEQREAKDPKKLVIKSMNTMSNISLHTINPSQTFEANAGNISRKIIELSQELKCGNGNLQDIKEIKDDILELKNSIPYNDVIDARKELIIKKFEDSVNELEMLIQQNVVDNSIPINDTDNADDNSNDNNDNDNNNNNDNDNSLGQKSFQITYTPMNAELIEQQEYESMQREIEINKIANSVIELNSIFKDMDKVVTNQGELVDNIENNIYNTVEHTRLANRELHKANMWDKKRRKCNFILFVIMIIVIIIIFALIV